MPQDASTVQRATAGGAGARTAGGGARACPRLSSSSCFCNAAALVKFLAAAALSIFSSSLVLVSVSLPPVVLVLVGVRIASSCCCSSPALDTAHYQGLLDSGISVSHLAKFRSAAARSISLFNCRACTCSASMSADSQTIFAPLAMHE